MDFQAMINSPGLWIASSVMVIATMVQALVFFGRDTGPVSAPQLSLPSARHSLL